MRVDVLTPDTCLGDVIGDLNKRRGKILGQESQKVMVKVQAEVPLSEMFGIQHPLRSLSSGQPLRQWSLRFFARVPQKLFKTNL